MGFEGAGGWVVLNEEVAVGQLGTDELFNFMVERKLARKEVFHLIDPKLGMTKRSPSRLLLGFGFLMLSNK